MKQLLKTLSVVLVFGTIAWSSSAQSPYVLNVDSIIGLPDTVVNGQEVTFSVAVSMNSPLFYQGAVYIELGYNGSTYAVDSSSAAFSFLGPNAPNIVQASHRFSTDDDLNIGDNVVVVWPRIGDGTDPPQEVPNPYELVITLIEPSGIDETERKRSPFFHPNPANSSIQVVNELISLPMTTNVFDAQGRMMISSINAGSIDVSQLSVGVYLIQILSSDGTLRSDRLFISR